MGLHLVFVLAGMALLTGGASALVRGASSLALRLGLTPLVVGLTVVAFGTSAPELVVSVQAALAGAGGIAVGNVVGSNIANVGLILALAALIAPVDIHPALLRRDVPLMIFASALAWVFLQGGLLGRAEGTVLLLGLAVYVAWSLYAARAAASTEAAAAYGEAFEPAPTGSLGHDLLFVGLGLAALVGGSELLVRGAVALASGAGVPEAVIGLTVVAIGTSLPELATTLVAALRGQGDLAAGNVVGSNLFNLLGILGTAAIVRPLDTTGFDTVDLAVMGGFAVALWPLLLTGRRLGRMEGLLLLTVYMGYVGYLAALHS